MNLSLCHEQSASLSEKMSRFTLCSSGSFPWHTVSSKYQVFPIFRSTVPVNGFIRFSQRFRHSSRKSIGGSKIGSKQDSISISAQALISFSEGESSSISLLSFVVRLVISKNSFLLKFHILRLAAGRLIVLLCLPSPSQNGIKKSPHLFGCELDSVQIGPCLFFQRLMSLFPDSGTFLCALQFRSEEHTSELQSRFDFV